MLAAPSGTRAGQFVSNFTQGLPACPSAVPGPAPAIGDAPPAALASPAGPPGAARHSNKGAVIGVRCTSLSKSLTFARV